MNKRQSSYSTCLVTKHSPQAYHSLRLGRRSAHDVGVVVEHGVLYHGGEDEQEANCDKQVHGRHVGHSRERVPGHCAQGGHGQHGGDTCMGEKCRSDAL